MNILTSGERIDVTDAVRREIVSTIATLIRLLWLWIWKYIIRNDI